MRGTGRKGGDTGAKGESRVSWPSCSGKQENEPAEARECRIRANRLSNKASYRLARKIHCCPIALGRNVHRHRTQRGQNKAPSTPENRRACCKWQRWESRP